jgi:hypothetical protein
MDQRRQNTSISPIGAMTVHAAIGCLVGVASGSALILTNAGGLKDLMMATGEPFIPMLVLNVSLASIFAMLAVSLHIFSRASDHER